MPTNFRPHAPDQNLLLAPRLRDCSFATGASSFYDLILSIEELAGHAVDVEQIKPRVFRNIDTIYRGFFANDRA